MLSGFALPAIAGLGIVRLSSPISAQAGERSGDRDDQAAGGCPPSFSEGTHETVLTEEAAEALADAGITFAPAAASTAVAAAPRPSTQLKLSVGSAALDLLTGVVSFDGGFTLSGKGRNQEVSFTAFTSQLAERVSTGWMSVNGEDGRRIPVLTYDLSKSTIKIEATSLTLESYDMLLAPQAISALKGVFPKFPLTSGKPFAKGSAQGTFLRS